jgi:hypothetical protein
LITLIPSNKHSAEKLNLNNDLTLSKIKEDEKKD